MIFRDIEISGVIVSSVLSYMTMFSKTTNASDIKTSQVYHDLHSHPDSPGTILL